MLENYEVFLSEFHKQYPTPIPETKRREKLLRADQTQWKESNDVTTLHLSVSSFVCFLSFVAVPVDPFLSTELRYGSTTDSLEMLCLFLYSVIAQPFILSLHIYWV